MAAVMYRMRGPLKKWRFSMGLVRVSVLNLSRVRAEVQADSNGLPYDPRSATVEFAFIEGANTNPGSSDWKTANWDVTLIGTYVAECRVGPGGTVTLGVGEYFTWIRITDVTAAETPVECIGKIIVE